MPCADPMRLHMPNEEVKYRRYKASRGYEYCYVTRSVAGRILGLPHVLSDKGERHFSRARLASAVESHACVMPCSTVSYRRSVIAITPGCGWRFVLTRLGMRGDLLSGTKRVIAACKPVLEAAIPYVGGCRGCEGLAAICAVSQLRSHTASSDTSDPGQGMCRCRKEAWNRMSNCCVYEENCSDQTAVHRAGEWGGTE